MRTTTEGVIDVEGLSDGQLEAEVATLAAHLYAGTCRWLELVGELDRRREWDEGHRSTAEWLAWRCNLTPRVAREHVRVARCLAELPLIHEAFGRGELSFAKVRALTRVAAPENEPELLELAGMLTAAQLERTLRAYRQVSTAEARDQLDDVYLSVFWNPDGSLEVHGRLAPEDGALLLRALDAQRDALWEAGRGSAEPRSARQASKAEALVAVAEASLSSEGRVRTGGDRYQVVLHADESALERDVGVAMLDDGSPLAPETARRLACDASVVRDGRKSRSIPAALRRALRVRDGGCRFPGCENRRFVDAHHVKHWAHGGETTVENLVLLCRCHHRAVHEGGYSVDADGRFFYPWGQPIPAVPRLPASGADALVERQSALSIADDTLQPVEGEGFQLADVVDGLLAFSS